MTMRITQQNVSWLSGEYYGIELGDEFNKEGELDIETYCDTYALTRKQVEQLRDHLTKVLENE